ncbi:hypothetical protein N7468_007031 [Penicillium chermesinum]|uniref:Uncharacterized protein n=1 Tax=Penicillium chermesinum TaxID=63820 RepID=A0A9W9NU41_9EURO|nr:uncharacterized protein N7468_007031 [Penicillium chermesinum]KAJ5225806.1 hypothetical protein N7468_007031 [Penicillium chermesinum]
MEPVPENPEEIASQLRRDQQLCRENKIPSHLTQYHTTFPPSLALPRSIRELRCKSIIEGIKAYLTHLDPDETENGFGDSDNLRSGQTHIPKTEEYTSALRVLKYLQTNPTVSGITPASSLTEVLAAVETQLAAPSDLRNKNHRRAQPSAPAKPKRCYICRQWYSPLQAHELYPSLCHPCGAFNLGSSAMSRPAKLKLVGKYALVTGGRINLGYCTALRLLRCGASVIVSSRYPRDAAMRYSREPDFSEWEPRLKVVGADFRSAKDAFQLVHTVISLLRSWNGEPESDDSKLDILINNAAQTLTDPVEAEKKAISREQALLGHPSAKNIPADKHSYVYRLRGGISASWIPCIEPGPPHLELESGAATEKGNAMAQKGLHTTAGVPSGKSSWVQTLNEIPYEDLISAHSVNAFVPLILCRELLPFMGSELEGAPSKPVGYIVNVSSREGILESYAKSRNKAGGHHVHTNMSKAAINMITETEASMAWTTRRVAMNSVDPGYMSAAPEYVRDEGCPIGFEDGAARVLWPVVAGEVEGRVISGRFLKHFEEGAAVIRRGD